MKPVPSPDVRVLVVEDDDLIAGVLQRTLTRAGHAVDRCDSATEGLWMAAEVTFDAIVLDGHLPDGDGLEICRKLRAAGSDALILMLTGRSELEDRITGLDAGADDYVTKPFEPEEVLARLRALRRRARSARPPVLRWADLEVDPADHQVRRAGTTIELTAREFELLLLLIEADGGVVHRSTIVETLWDFASETDSNTLDVHVRNLRAKVDRPFGTPLIETVRGVGYRLGG